MTGEQIQQARLGRRAAMRTLGAGSAVVGAALATGGLDGAAKAEAGQRLEGSWAVAVAPAGGQLGPARVLVSFTTEGVAVRTAPVQQAAPPALGVARMFIGTTHGEWVRTGNREFLLTFIGFAFDEAGNFLATQRIRVAPSLGDTPDTFSGPFTTNFLAADGTVVASSSGTVQGTRIGVEPLEG